MSADFWDDRNILHVPRVTKKKKKRKKECTIKTTMGAQWEPLWHEAQIIMCQLSG